MCLSRSSLKDTTELPSSVSVEKKAIHVIEPVTAQVLFFALSRLVRYYTVSRFVVSCHALCNVVSCIASYSVVSRYRIMCYVTLRHVIFSPTSLSPVLSRIPAAALNDSRATTHVDLSTVVQKLNKPSVPKGSLQKLRNHCCQFDHSTYIVLYQLSVVPFLIFSQFDTSDT